MIPSIGSVTPYYSCWSWYEQSGSTETSSPEATTEEVEAVHGTTAACLAQTGNGTDAPVKPPPTRALDINTSALAAPTPPTCSTNNSNKDVNTIIRLTPTVTASTTLELSPNWEWDDVYPPLAELRRELMTDAEWAAMSDWEKDVWEMKHRPEWERLACIDQILESTLKSQREEKRVELMELTAPMVLCANSGVCTTILTTCSMDGLSQNVDTQSSAATTTNNTTSWMLATSSPVLAPEVLEPISTLPSSPTAGMSRAADLGIIGIHVAGMSRRLEDVFRATPAIAVVYYTDSLTLIVDNNLQTSTSTRCSSICFDGDLEVLAPVFRPDMIQSIKQQGQVLRPMSWPSFECHSESAYLHAALGSFWYVFCPTGEACSCWQYEHIQQGRPPDRASSWECMPGRSFPRGRTLMVIFHLWPSSTNLGRFSPVGLHDSIGCIEDLVNYWEFTNFGRIGAHEWIHSRNKGTNFGATDAVTGFLKFYVVAWSGVQLLICKDFSETTLATTKSEVIPCSPLQFFSSGGAPIFLLEFFPDVSNRLNCQWRVQSCLVVILVQISTSRTGADCCTGKTSDHMEKFSCCFGGSDGTECLDTLLLILQCTDGQLAEFMLYEIEQELAVHGKEWIILAFVFHLHAGISRWTSYGVNFGETENQANVEKHATASLVGALLLKQQVELQYYQNCAINSLHLHRMVPRKYGNRVTQLKEYWDPGGLGLQFSFRDMAILQGHWCLGIVHNLWFPPCLNGKRYLQHVDSAGIPGQQSSGLLQSMGSRKCVQNELLLLQPWPLSLQADVKNEAIQEENLLEFMVTLVELQPWVSWKCFSLQEHFSLLNFVTKLLGVTSPWDPGVHKNSATIHMGWLELERVTWMDIARGEFTSRYMQITSIELAQVHLGNLGEMHSAGDTCFADEVIQPALTYPGAYRRVSVGPKIHHLAVNSLLKSSQVDEMEGRSIGSFENDIPPGPNATKTDFNDTSLSRPAFQVLKQLIQRCISDAVSSANVFADAILQHLYRWVCSPRSRLHDPALHRLLHNVMKKVFALLLTELIIDTGKVDLPSARAYCDSLLKTLQTRDLFEWIELEPMHYWHSLLFMDQYNYGGIQAKTQNVTSADSSDGDNDIDIVSSWNIAEYLPKATQDHFVLIVSEFLYIPWKYMKEQVACRAAVRDDTSCTPSITIMAAENLEAQVIDYLRGQISIYFAEKLLTIVSNILLHFKGKRKSESVEPSNREVDPHSHKGDGALEFIKHICAVLALDQNVQHDILGIRKNLLKLVRVKEFAPEAQFQDPCASFTLPNVICSYCNDCRDLDLCRDSTLQGHEWRCAVPQCGQPYHHDYANTEEHQVPWDPGGNTSASAWGQTEFQGGRIVSDPHLHSYWAGAWTVCCELGPEFQPQVSMVQIGGEQQ